MDQPDPGFRTHSGENKGRAQVVLSEVGGRLSKAFAAVTMEGLDGLMPEALGWIGRYSEVDISFAAVVSDNRVTDVWEWTESGEPGRPPKAGTTAADGFPVIIDFLRMGIAVPIEDMRAIDVDPVTRDNFESIDARSIALIPVLHGGTLVGVTGFLTVGRTRSWSETTMAELQFFADLMLAAIVRTKFRSATALAESRALRIAAFIPDALLFCDANDRVTWASPSTASVLGLEPGRLEGRTFADLAHPDDHTQLKSLLAETWLTRARAGTLRLETGNGEFRWFEVSTSLADASGALASELLLSARDVHERHLEIEHLADESSTDHLTGVLNRRGLRQVIDDLQPGYLPVGVAFIDLDRFKAVNDTFGHEVGDEVLVQAARRVQDRYGHNCWIARLGGDEFIVVRPLASETDLARMVQDIRSDMAVAFPTTAGWVTIGGSVGTARMLSMDGRSKLLSDADASMYKAKQSGRTSAPKVSSPLR